MPEHHTPARMPLYLSGRFCAGKSSAQYWSGPANHCTVPGCTSVTVTLTTGGARNDGGRALASAHLAVPDPALLLLAPLAILALSRRKGKRPRWTGPLA